MDFPVRRPSQDERDEIAALLKLTPEQAERLWRAVYRMCRGFDAYRAAKPLPGAERAATLDHRQVIYELARLIGRQIGRDLLARTEGSTGHEER